MISSKSVVALLWGVALVLAGWTLSALPLRTLGNSMAALTWTQWLLWIGLNFAIVLLATKRWQVLTDMVGAPIRFSSLLIVRQAGQAISFITPGPQFGGEPLQIYFLHRDQVHPLRRIVLALGLDRIYELLVNFSALLVGVLFLLAQGSAVANWRGIAVALLIVVVLIATIGWLLIRQPRWMRDRLQHQLKRWEQHPRLRSIAERLQTSHTEQSAPLTHRNGPMVNALILSLSTWIVLLMELALLLRFVGVEVTPTTFVLITIALRLALLLPLPGGIGTVEASVLWSFQLLALPLSAAIGLIGLMRLRDAVVLLTGLFSLRLLQRRGSG